MAVGLEKLSNFGVCGKLCGEGALADAGGVGFADADDAVDMAWRGIGAGAGAGGGGVA